MPWWEVEIFWRGKWSRERYQPAIVHTRWYDWSPSHCIFTEASTEACGIRAYIRWQTTDKSFVIRFVAAKSRETPGLELQAVFPVTWLCQTIVEESRLQLEEITFFSDTNIVLAWIRCQAREFKPIFPKKSQSKNNHLRGVKRCRQSTSWNISEQLRGSWKEGPKFLLLPEEE